MGRLTKILSELKRCTSGNAMLLVAIGAPVLIGGAGLGVDVAQFYLFKRELQYAADQGAMAGAWARGNGDTGTAYQTRAEQELSSNLSTTADYTLTHDATLADYGTGTANSVVVTASITTELPFSKFMLGQGTTISVRSQAIWETLSDYDPCLFALHPTANAALWFNGGPNVDAACGVGAMSEAGNAIRTNGSSGPQNINFAVTGGQIVDEMNAFANSEMVENMTNLTDPFEGLTPPDNPTSRSLSCNSSSTGGWSADETRNASVSYQYYRGQNANRAEGEGTISYSGPGMSSPSSSTTTLVGQTYSSEPNDNTQTVNGDLYQIAGSGPDKIYEQAITVTGYTFANKTYTPPSSSSGAMLPGTYTDFEISCDTVLSGGIYVIDGGRLKLNAGNELTGNGVMFVLKNNAEVDINGGATVFLTPMTKNELIAAGVPSDDAERMEGMLIFEDPETGGHSGSRLNGGASFDLNGVIYMPNSNLMLSGNMQATSECLMIMSSMLQLSGTADLTTLCPPGDEHDITVGGGGTRVRLVA